jgi:type I restriction enzyme S subunit
MSVKLGEVADFVRGINFKPEDVVPVGAPGSLPCMRTKNVQAELDLSDLWAVGEAFVRRPDQFLQPGDTLVSSANSWNLVGKCCWIPELPWRATFGGFVSVLRPDRSKVDPRFLFRWFASDRIQTTLRSFGRQTTNISNLNIGLCLGLPLPLPPLAEQRRIAEVLDRAEALRAKRRATLATLDALTHAVFLDIFGDPATNPKGWPSCLLGDLFGIARGGSPRPIDAYFTDDPDGINWVLISDASDGEKYITATKKRIRPEGARRSRPVQPGDFLLTNSMSFGRPYIMRTYGCIHDGWLVLSPKTDDIDADFFYELLGSRAMYAEFERRAAGATVKNLNIDLVRGVRVPIPPKSIQRDFARRAGAIEALRATQLASLNDLASLFASLQHRAFLGEL